MKLRRVTAAISVSALAFVGLAADAGADASFTVSDSTITAGGSVTVGLTEPCLDGNGDPAYGNLISSSTSSPAELENQETKGDGFTNGASGVFHFDTPGTYTISRFCDGYGLCSQVTITVTAPATTTTTSTTTTAAPTTTTTAPKATTTTVAPKATTTSTTVAPTTTVSAVVAGVSATPGKATGATPVKASKVSYTG